MNIDIANAVPAPCARAENAPRHSENHCKPPRGSTAGAATPGNSDVTIQANDVSNMFQSFHLKH
ncbi:hypothetical protein [Janthinobacterium sp. FW305-128]|uniref:hypothetical protein n=1 Tax=Janthinobacterium sp. FW305-128 TaxID=2775055 RepID=UPI001E36335F|nr:hypothetical protein [Janthinobacterium sp. FW305-128]MCC7681844.1 hypothetical protein [Janthinobacterium sp. FW305-128]